MAECIKAHLRGGDALYRYGGEEFLVILAEQTVDGARIAMERVRNAIAALGVAHEANPPGLVLTISGGIAVLASGADESAEHWLQRADDALYRAKQAGRNRVEE